MNAKARIVKLEAHRPAPAQKISGPVRTFTEAEGYPGLFREDTDESAELLTEKQIDEKYGTGTDEITIILVCRYR